MKNFIQVNPALTIEDFGEEIIIVNLQTGAYFSLKGTAAAAWRAIVSSPSDDPLAALSLQFTLNEASLTELRQLLRQFSDDELVALPEHVLNNITPTALATQPGKPAFSTPVYEKFTNMQDILLLDPIHDVSELGWPYRK
ncbi:MAG: hypothetical protein AAB316_07855 [Bacteroidota bacterium]